MIFFYDTDNDAIRGWVRDNGLPSYRADQIIKWKAHGIISFDEMRNIPVKIREMLAERFYANGAEIVGRTESESNGTVKYILKLKDGNIIECVLMRYSYGNSVCISSQAGCRMGCSFCASAGAGFGRDLTSGEMLIQVMTVIKDSGDKISNIVVMGIGEPFDNYDNLIMFIKEANDPDMLGIGMRRIAVSTCGLVPEMLKFTDEGLPVTLSVSLHAPNDVIRNKIMPISLRYGIDELLEACRNHTEKTGRRITFEYILLKGVNDRDEHACELASKLRGMLCHVNLIPANEFEQCGYEQSTAERVRRFRDILEEKGVNVTIRRELGADIKAACGQLRRNMVQGGMV
ncbi:MAG: 23S rRNA (adenine(2503)-C(2))-methyltransferase RlmN [Eubacteriales bacterium]|nr:23S rRNA (adenine(2503)-C(2))-methyltransferase RlmN [Eubacteriales bacterium]